MDTTQSPHRHFATILVILLSIALLGVVPCITIDGKSYYLQLRSIIYGGDASFYDEMLYHYEGYAPDYYIVDALPTGYVPNLFPLGFAVILTPFFIFGHLIALLLCALGCGPPPAGYSFPEVLSTLMASAVLGSAGLLISAVTAGRLFGIRSAFWATLGVWLASPLPAYIYAQPSFAHALSVFTTCLVLLVWLQPVGESNTRRALAMGLAIGLATLVRWQDGVYLILPAWDVIRSVKTWKFWRTVRYMALVGAGTLTAALPQLVLWKIQFGHWVTIPQGEGFMRWLEPQILPVLFSAQHGLISWTPMLAIAFIAIVWMAIRKPWIGVPILVLLIVQTYVNSVVLDWWAGWGFGGRRFLDLVPFFILATAFLFKDLPGPVRKAVPYVIGALILWNASLLYHYFAGHVPFGGKVFFSDWLTQNWRLLTQQPHLGVGAAVVLVGILWLAARRLRGTNDVPHDIPILWKPSIWMIIVASAYLIGWSSYLGATTLGITRMQVLNPEPRFRDWIQIAAKPPFEGSGLRDIATPDQPWREFASWSVKPGGTWKLVTACLGNLAPGDTAAVLSVESLDGSSWQLPLRWDEATGPLEIPARYCDRAMSTGDISRIDLPPDIKGMPYRTFAPLPLYLITWARFVSSYSKGDIPLNAAYEYTFRLPDDFKPNRFEIRVQEVELCYIYGIARLE